jgi:RimJ/RimL family protein N-acetyltransferase
MVTCGLRCERAMLNQLTIEPLQEGMILWRCLHGGPMSEESLESPPPNPRVDWPAIRARNIPLLEKLTHTYGACAIVARDGGEIIASLRFYPIALCSFGISGAGFCLQQSAPAGPADDLAACDFPPLKDLPDKTLFVHCLMVVSPAQEPGRYRRQGVASGLVRELIRWARETGWRAIEATAYEEIPLLYDIAGVAGKCFWQKLGFSIVRRDTEAALLGEFFEVASLSAASVGIPAERTANRYRMRLELTAAGSERGFTGLQNHPRN